MVLPADGGAAQVEILIEKVREIATSTMADLEAEAHRSTASFRDLSLSSGVFGEVPLGHVVARQHRAAHDVFVTTIEGVIADLRDFQTNLLASADSHEATDEAAHAALVRLGQSYSDGNHVYRSDENYHDSRVAHDRDLGGADGPDGDTGGDTAGDPAGDPAATGASPASSGAGAGPTATNPAGPATAPDPAGQAAFE